MRQIMLVRGQADELSAFVRRSVLRGTVAVFLSRKDYVSAADSMEKDIRGDLRSGTAKTAEVCGGISAAGTEWFAIAPDGLSQEEVSECVAPMLESKGY